MTIKTIEFGKDDTGETHELRSLIDNVSSKESSSKELAVTKAY